MTHPILDLQTALVSTLNADSALVAQIGTPVVFDMPPKGRHRPYLVIQRHDVIVRDVTQASVREHVLRLLLWMPEPSRSAMLPALERITALMTKSNLSSATRTVTTVRHVRTDTDMDMKGGGARAALSFRIFSEPAI